MFERAHARARAAQPAWAALTGTERARVLRRVSDILRQRNDELALIEMRGWRLREAWMARAGGC